MGAGCSMDDGFGSTNTIVLGRANVGTANQFSAVPGVSPQVPIPAPLGHLAAMPTTACGVPMMVDALSQSGAWRQAQARRSSAEHLIATNALRRTATAWMLTVAERFAKF